MMSYSLWLYDLYFLIKSHHIGLSPEATKNWNNRTHPKIKEISHFWGGYPFHGSRHIDQYWQRRNRMLRTKVPASRKAQQHEQTRVPSAEFATEFQNSNHPEFRWQNFISSGQTSFQTLAQNLPQGSQLSSARSAGLAVQRAAIWTSMAAESFGSEHRHTRC